MTRGVALAARLVALVFAGAGCAPSSSVFEGHGVVQEVQSESSQVVIAHDEIAGLMPAMTMNFDVPDRALLESLTAGQVIDFQLEVQERHHRVTGVRVERWVEPEEGWSRLGEVLVRTDPAPDFALVDQGGRPFSLRDLAGKNALLDFIYTRCPGPCPIVTGLHAAVQRALPEAARTRSHFVSITLDPEHDTPEILVDYARRRGADLSNWSFLTGSRAAVEAVTRAFGVGATLREDREIDHIVVSFLIDDRGRIAKRYFGVETDPQSIAADLQQLTSETAPAG